MGDTNPQYQVWEIAVAMTTKRDLESGHERVDQGDIVAVRLPHHCIGKKERQEFLWLRVDGLEDNQMSALADACFEGEVACDKRRYCIPLQRLKAVVPDLRTDWAADPAVPYQPFLPCDDDTGEFLSHAEPLSVFGLVFDKHTMEYL